MSKRTREEIEKNGDQRHQRIKDEIARLGVEFSNESDRALIIVAVARIEELLGEVVEARLLERSSNDAPFSVKRMRLGSRLECAFRTGIIDAEFRRLISDLISIRNEIAHSSKSFSLNDESWSRRDTLTKLISSEEDKEGVPFVLRRLFVTWDLVSDFPFYDMPEMNTDRQRMEVLVSFVITVLIELVTYTERICRLWESPEYIRARREDTLKDFRD